MRRALAATGGLLLALAAAGTATATPPGLNGRIAFERSTASGQLHSIPATGEPPSAVRLTFSAEGDHDAAWSPDGTKIAFTSMRDGGDEEIYIMNADGSNPVRFTKRTGVDEQPSWSPDGTRIAWASDQFSNLDIVSAKLDGTDFRQHTSNGAFTDTEPEWSPGGSRIAFRSNRSGSGDIYSVTFDGGPEAGLRQLTDDPASDTSPTWSPDASRIAFASDRAANQNDIWSVSTAGSGAETDLRRLTSDPGEDTAPAWSPDGARVAFAASRGGGTTHIWTVSTSGTEVDPQQLTSTVLVDSAPAWQSVAPAPALSSLSPASVVSGSGDVAVIVDGSNFVRRSQVRWNGAPRATQFVSSTRLTFVAPAADLAAPGTGQVTVSTSPVGGGASTALPFTVNPGIILTRALLQPRWRASRLRGRLDLRGVVGRPAALQAEVLRASGAGKALVTRRFQVPSAGAFSLRLQLKPNLLPGRYVVRVSEAGGGALALPTAQRATSLSGPAEGVAARAFLSTKIGGRPLARITTHPSIIFAQYTFASLPRGKKRLTVRWFAPGARRAVAVDRKPVRRQVLAFIKSRGPLPSGAWRAELRYGGKLVAVAKTRVA